MNSLYGLVKNETIKMMKKKRFYVVLLILLALIPMFTYAQMRIAENSLKQYGTTDWKAEQRQRIADWTKSLSSPRIPEERKQNLKVQIQLADFYLKQDIDPRSPDAVTFMREFVKNSITLFIPLIVMVIAADIVSSEFSSGTMKLLLTRPVSRWKILMSKLITLVFFVSLIIFSIGLLSYLISGAVFGFSGWDKPTMIGFQVVGTEVDYSHVRVIDQWLYVLMEFGLVWFVGFVVAMLSMMLSVLIRSTAAGMGVMLAALISGMILINMVSSWESAKYLFMVNLDLTSYLSGSLPPIKGMDLSFSLTVLTVWTLASLVVSFMVFTRKDVYN